MKNNLPPGQYEINEFPRFGLLKYAKRYRSKFDPLDILISGNVQNTIRIATEDLNALPRIQQTSDFHCVTTWTKCDQQWSGFRFIDFYETIVKQKALPSKESISVHFKSQDGFRSCLPLSDLLADDVLLADSLDGVPLTAKHGAPLRLITPAHYGYKSIKHLKAIEFWPDDSGFQPPAFRFMNHPRGRVEFEERGRWIPGWCLRYLYRLLVKPTITIFKRTM